jgi:hypothetical protein
MSSCFLRASNASGRGTDDALEAVASHVDRADRHPHRAFRPGAFRRDHEHSHDEQGNPDEARSNETQAVESPGDFAL